MNTTQPPEINEQVLAVQIAQISDAMAKLLKSGLNQDAVVCLLRDATGIGKRDIELVLHGLKYLKSKYTTVNAAQPVKKQ